ncbi:MAG: calcium-translocating P-type ATPase, PMCA-type [Eubacteriales bacterium]|nr:calcium-translocating P-type ATPase, PMCA-type [Eubacteriales bacterium]
MHEDDSNKGLTSEQASKLLEEYGENRLRETKRITFWGLFFSQFKSILIVILIVASMISAFVGEFTESVAIMVIVLLNALIGAKQEKSAGDAVQALKNMTSPYAKVIRDGVIKEIPSEGLVPGDIVQLDTGSLVPADLKLLNSVNLKIEESSLTGESVPVEKDSKAFVEDGSPLAERINMAYMGTTVIYGRSLGIITNTGMSTEIGKIADVLDEKDDETPLQKKLNALGNKLGITCIVVCILIFLLGLLRNMPVMEIFMISVSLAVAAVPEGLPAIVTVILALGMKRMVKRNVLAKSLSSVETLGSTTVICSDKTGTLTQNKMTVTNIMVDMKEYEVTGTGYGLEGLIKDVTPSAGLDYMMKAAILNNDAILDSDQEGIIGDPTEGALIVMAAKSDYNQANIRNKYPRLSEIPFDSDRKMMSTSHSIEGQHVMFTKGSPDSILEICDRIQILDDIVAIDNYRDQINSIYLNWASNALRVLCYAYKEVTSKDISLDEEKNMIFCGMSGMIDPSRPEVFHAIEKCHTAGIRTIMITGDHAVTASAIGREIGLLNGTDAAITGREIDKMDDETFMGKLAVTNAFSRVSPDNKVRIVSALKQSGHIVAMTGDGVNDAPSLKKADIGIAMGITGTDVSKEAADMILTDDNFVSIVVAIQEGRVIFSNIRKFVSFLISCNIGEIALIFIAMLLGWGSPLRPIQLLWVNLITDSFPAFALGMEPEEDDVMKQKPRNPNAPIIDKKMTVSVIFQATGLALATLLSFRFGFKINPDYANTFAFVTLISGELLRAFSGRSETKSLFKTGFFSNKYLNLAVVGSYVLTFIILITPALRNIFAIHALSPNHLMIAFGFSLIPLLFGELSKLFKVRN